MGACEETSREGAGVAARRAGRWQVLGVTPKGVSLGQQRGRLGDTETPREARGTERDSKRRTEGHETETRRVREGKRLTHSDRHPEKLWAGDGAAIEGVLEERGWDGGCQGMKVPEWSTQSGGGTKRVQSRRENPWAATPTGSPMPHLCLGLSASSLGQGLCLWLQLCHVGGSPFLSLSLPVSVFISPCSPGISSNVSLRVCFPLCVSPTTFLPSGMFLSSCLTPAPATLFCSASDSPCPTFSVFSLRLAFPVFFSSSLSLYLSPPTPHSLPPTSPIYQVSRDPKGGRGGGAQSLALRAAQGVGGCQILGLLPSDEGWRLTRIEAGPWSPGTTPILPLKPPPSTPR